MPIISFARSARLRQTHLFRKVLRSGRKSSGEYLTVYWEPDETEESMRCGFSVSRRVARKAVARNRMKRLLREALKREQNLFPPPEKGRVVIVAHRMPAPMNLDCVQKELKQCLARF